MILQSNTFSICISSLHAAAEGDAITVSVVLSDGNGNEEKKAYRIRTELFAELQVHKGNISEETLENIEKAALLSDAYMRGAYMLSYGANSKGLLVQKLCRKQFPRDIAMRAAVLLEEHGYIREDNDAKREADKCIAKYWGKRRILAHLRERGFQEEAIREVDCYLVSIDFLPACCAAARSISHKPPVEHATREKIAASLFRRGFTGDEIRKSLAIAWKQEKNTPSDV